MSLSLHLVETAFSGLIRSLGLKSMDDLSASGEVPSKDEQPPAALLAATDQGSAVDCLVGLFELTRFFIDAVALADPQHIFSADLLEAQPAASSAREDFLCFLIRRVVFTLLDFSLRWEPAQMSKRWISRDQFFAAVFDQVEDSFSSPPGHLDSIVIRAFWCCNSPRSLGDTTSFRPDLSGFDDSADVRRVRLKEKDGGISGRRCLALHLPHTLALFRHPPGLPFYDRVIAA
ncbi:unnamed protein product [Dibothriocephalus latus]|uniref:Uncharacterized protein n=1 Tax=Dibothriocephalus latus TaxID=60516 RepID=A0A3P6RM20_DIBLA|nr:unnamed protein product [Dibothriocephalus latus]